MDRRERLVGAMQELLWERGYAGTSPAAVLQRAEVGQGSMYHHFGGKADLAAAALDRSGADLRDAGARFLDGSGGALERIRAYLLRDRAVLMGCPIGRMTGDADVLADERLRRPVDETLGWYRTRLAEVIEEGQSAGELDPALSAVRVGAAIAATLQGAYVLARAAGSTGPYDDAIEGVLELLAAHRTTD